LLVVLKVKDTLRGMAARVVASFSIRAYDVSRTYKNLELAKPHT
jgi:hypothetical protein